MIYRDEETYQLFDDNQNKPENQEFGYKESYWDEMEGMLDANDAKRKKRKGILFAFSSVAAVALVFLGLSTLSSDEIGTSAIVFNPDSESSSSSNKLLSDNYSNSKLDIKERKENSVDQMNTTENKIHQQSSSKTSTTSNKFNSNTPVNVEADENLNKDIVAVVSKENSSSTLDEDVIILEKLEVSSLEQNASMNSINLENRKAKFKLMHSLSVNAEGGVANKYQSEMDVSYAALIGLGYELRFHKNLSFQTGANFIYRDGLAQTYKNETKVYGFESTRYYQDISYKGQLNIEIPVSLKVRMKRSSITAGVGTSFLLGVRSSVSQYMPESSSTETVKNNWGIKDGIRKMDVNLNLSYSYAVTTNMELTAGLSAGLLDQTDNQFFSSDEKNYNMQFRLGLKYFFLNK